MKWFLRISITLLAIVVAHGVFINFAQTQNRNPHRIIWGGTQAKISLICIEGHQYIIAENPVGIDIEPLIGKENCQ